MARVFQDTREKRTLGAKAPWWVEWRDNGRRRSQKIGDKKTARSFAALKASESLHRRNGVPINKPWSEFRAEYERDVVPTMRSIRSQEKALQVVKAFENEMKPKYVGQIDQRTLDAFKAQRLKRPGKKRGDTLSLATVRSELGALRAILNVAVGWGYLPTLPQMPKVKSLDEDKPFVTADHFNAMVKACGVARLPRAALHPKLNCTPAEWWRALLTTAWVTGMRIGALLALRWEDVDLVSGIAVSRARANKGKRDQRHFILPVVDLLKPLRGFDVRMFPWNHDRRTLDDEFDRIQEAAGVKLVCPHADRHTCTQACHFYGFHSLRYAHATYNFGRVDDKALQEQMGHASFETTKHYIKFAEKQQSRAYDAFLPSCFADFASVAG